MKKLNVLFRVLCLCMLCAPYQTASAEEATTDYVPMLEAGKCWKHCIHDSRTKDDWTLRLDNEIEIDGQKWYPMKSYLKDTLMNNGPICYLREDTAAKKIWVRFNDNSDVEFPCFIATFVDTQTERVLYDFNDYEATFSGLTIDVDYDWAQFKDGQVNGFPGQVGNSYAIVQGLGLVPVGVTAANAFSENQACTFLGLPAFCDCIDPTYPFLYAVEDGDGNRIFEVPLLASASESSLLADAQQAEVRVENGAIVIKVSAAEEAKIYDSQGKLLRTIQIVDQTHIDNLPAGVYVIVISGKPYKAIL